MEKRILLTGATDGIGLETAKMLAAEGHKVLLRGRNPAKLENVAKELSSLAGGEKMEIYVADLSRLDEVEALAKNISEKHKKLDVLINNAGIFKTNETVTENGLDVRFVVNTVAPYLLTIRLLPLFEQSGRIINLSSAAQAPVDLKALTGQVRLSDMEAYAQSKLALTMWSREMAISHPNGLLIVSVNPGSMLGSKMVKEAFGVAGGDLRIGADILVRAPLSDEFANATGQYFDNDQGRFAPPHPDAMNSSKNKAVISTLEAMLRRRK